MKTPDNIIINNTTLDLNVIGVLSNEITVHTLETFLPRILKEFGFFQSTSQIKKNRPELWVDAEKFHMETIKIGHRRVWIFVGG